MTRALAVLAVIALIAVGAWAYLRPGPPAAAPSASPTATATSTATAALASPTPSATPAGSVSPTPSPTATATVFGQPLTTGGVTVRAAAATPSADFRYVSTRESTGTKHWVVLLDLAGRKAHYVAEVEIAVPAGSQAVPSVAISPSADGRSVLVAATEPEGLTQLFHLVVASGQVFGLRTLDQFSTAVLSPDGSRFAFTDLSADAASHGLWVYAGGGASRVIASSPLRSGGPARPVAFSPDGTQLAAVVTFGPGDNGIAIVAATAAEVRINDQSRTVEGATMLERGAAFDWRGAPGDAWAWESRDAGGGTNAIYTYDTQTAAGTLVYRPADGIVLAEVQRSPKLDRFATLERTGVARAAPGAVWVRTRAGSATKAADVGEAGPHSVWWSPDGSRLYAIVMGDDSVAGVVDVLTGEAIVTYCVRNAGPECV